MGGQKSPIRTWSRRLVGAALVAAIVGLPAFFLYQGRYGTGAAIAGLREQAAAAMGRGDPGRAAELLLRAADLAPESSSIQCDLGLAWIGAGDRESGLAALDRAAALDVDAIRPRLHQALLAMEERRLDRVRSLLSWLRDPARSARIRQFQENVCWIAGRLAYLEGDAAAAVAEIDEALEANPRSVAVLRTRAQLALVQGRSDDAVGFAVRALEESPDDPSLRTLVSQAHEAAGDRQAARDALGLSGTALPADQEVVLAVRLAELASAEGDAASVEAALARIPEDGPAAPRRYVEGLLSAARVDLAAAEERFRLALDREPFLIGARLARASALLGLGRHEAARAEAVAVLDQDPLCRAAILLSARTALEAGELDRAAEEAERAFRIAPSDLEAIRLVIGVRTRQGRIEDAIRFFGNFESIDPAGEVAALGRNLSWLAAMELDSAIEGSQQLLSRSPTATGALEVLASAYAAKRGLADTLERLELLFSSDPRFLAFRFQLAEVYASVGREDLAETELRELLEEGAGKDEGAGEAARLGLGFLALRKKDWHSAIEHATAHLAVRPGSPSGLLLLTRAYLESGNPDQALRAAEGAPGEVEEGAASRLVGLARTGLAAAIELGDFEAARCQFERAHTARPGLPRTILAGAAIALGDLEAARAELDLSRSGLASGSPELADVEFLEAVLQFETGDPSGAVEHARVAYPAASLARTIVLADCLLALGDRDGAREAVLDLQHAARMAEDPIGGPLERALCTHVEETSPERVREFGPLLHGLLVAVVFDFRAPVHALAPRLQREGGDVALSALVAARSLDACGSRGMARALLEEANSRHPGSAAVLEALAAMLVEDHEAHRAAALLEEATAASPTDSRLHLYLGFAREELGDPSGALLSYRAAAALDPGSASAANSLAWLLLRQGREIDLALEHASRARLLAPGSAQVLDTLGLAQLLRERVAEALTTLRRAAELAPREPIVRLHLARAYRESGQLESAREEIDMAVLLAGPDRVPEVEVALADPQGRGLEPRRRGMARPH